MAETKYKYEIIFVNDGSNCNTWEMISLLSDIFPFIRGINLTGNYGQTVALRSGFASSKGDVILVMDGDMQHDPAYMPVFLAYIERGYDLVCGFRNNNYQEGLFKSLFVNTAQKMVSVIAGFNIKYLGITYKAYRRYLFENVFIMGDANRFLDAALIANKETKIIEVPIKFRTINAALN